MQSECALFKNGEKVEGVQRVAWLFYSREGGSKEFAVYTDAKLQISGSDSFSVDCDDGVRRDAVMGQSHVDIFGWRTVGVVHFRSEEPAGSDPAGPCENGDNSDQ